VQLIQRGFDVDVTVLVATHGDPEWSHLAQQRAIPSAEALGCPVIHVHGDTLHGARNEALERATTEWVIHLDADDELERGFVDRIAAGTCDLRAPAVRYVRNGFVPTPYVPKVAGHRHACTADCLPEGNWLVVGTAVRRDMVIAAGGWRDLPMYEDWDLWVRCWRAGATIEAVPSAVYRAHVRRDSRNRGPCAAERLAAHQMIARDLGLPVPA
jgi:glycosyltransferase involved in cell wall biosynthesis